MTSTIKFSEFTSGGDLANSDLTVGYATGVNLQFNNPWTFLAPGSTGDRPVPAADNYYRLRLNTDLQVYEYYDPITAQWVELSGSGTGTVNPGTTNTVAFYAANGTALSPTNTANLAVLSTNSSGFPAFSTTLPTGLSIPSAIITASTAALTSGQVAAVPVNPTDLVNKLYVDTAIGGDVTSITGTTNQVIASSPTGNVTLSLPQSIALGSTPTFGGLTLTSIPLGSSSGGTGINNGSSTLTLGGSLATIGAFASNFTMTGATNVTFPTSGTLATVGGTVSSITGTANEIIASASTGAVNLSTPQSLATTAAFQVNTLQLNSSNGILDANGNFILGINPIALSVNNLYIQNSATGGAPGIFVGGADANVSFEMGTKGTGIFVFFAGTSLTNQLQIVTGLTNNHSTYFNFATTSNSRTVTFPDASGTVVFAGGGQVVDSITGTANEIIASASTGAVTLSTPQSLATTAAFQVNTLQLNIAAPTGNILGMNGNAVIRFGDVVSAVNYWSMNNSAAGGALTLGVLGTDSNVNVTITSKGTGIIDLQSAALTIPLVIASGTSSQHTTFFSFSNTANSRTVTFPDADFTFVGTASAMTNGQIPIGNTGNLPTAATITAGAGISVTNGAGSITLAAIGGGLTVSTIAGTTQTAAVNTKYFALNAGQTTLTLPATYAVGDIVALIGATANAGGWIVATATGDTIRVNNTTTSVSGTVTSSAVAGQTIYLECDVANTSWVMSSTVSVTLTTT